MPRHDHKIIVERAGRLIGRCPGHKPPAFELADEEADMLIPF